MKTLDKAQLSNVTGGTSSSNDQITQALTAITSSLKDLSTNKDSSSSSSSSMMMMAMMMAMRPQGGGATVVAGGGAPPAAAPGPVINVDTRVGRHCFVPKGAVREDRALRRFRKAARSG
jgi:hypothetical protein